MKFVVAAGALLGIMGVFLPLARVQVGGGGGILSLGMSLWAGAALTGASFIAYAILGLFVLTGLFAGIGFAKGFGRGLAIGALIPSLATGGLGVVWLSDAMSLGAAGAGTWFLAIGGVAALVGAIVTLVKPERRAQEMTARAAAA
jgi:hypothetical protein